MLANSFKENIIEPSLNFIKNDTKVKVFYFLPWILSIILLTVILLYQSIYTYIVLLWNKEEALKKILDFFHSGYLVEVLVTGSIFLIFYILLTPIFEWGLIAYIDKKTRDEHVSCSESFWIWLVRFYKTFEFNWIFWETKFISILNSYLFCIRFIWIEYVKYITYTFVVVFLLSIVINILTAYAKYEIVLRNKWVFSAIWTSSNIAILNLKTTLKIYFLKFLLNIRVVINFLVFLSFPVLFVLMFGFVTSWVFLVMWLTILTILFLFLLLFIGYITSVLEIFTTSVWYFAYRIGEMKLKEIE